MKGIDSWVSFGQIGNTPIVESDAMRPWERFFSWTSVSGESGESGGGSDDDKPIRSLPRYPTYLMMGSILLALANRLSKNRAFHLIVAAVVGMAVSAVLVLALVLWTLNNIRYHKNKNFNDTDGRSEPRKPQRDPVHYQTRQPFPLPRHF